MTAFGGKADMAFFHFGQFYTQSTKARLVSADDKRATNPLLSSSRKPTGTQKARGV